MATASGSAGRLDRKRVSWEKILLSPWNQSERSWVKLSRICIGGPAEGDTMKFTYSSGQRVLDGYTLKRGIGRGGFGEVYYALSDGGKEVALKLVRGHNLEVEMRGMAQCLNLKHPNLMTLIDLRTDAQGDHWVVMEYISGEPLSVVLNRHPQGLPMELAQQWFVALAKAVSCLHDQ